MKQVKIFCFLAVAVLLAACHSNDDRVGNWKKWETFGGKGRTGAVSFTIGAKAYVGLGVDGDIYECTDFWSFDGTSWSNNVDPFPGVARHGAVAFSDGTYAYVGLGYNLHDKDQTIEEYFTDFYRFNPAATRGSQWELIGDVPAELKPRKYAIAFCIEGKGYIGGGYGRNEEGVFKDYWEFDPQSTTWRQIESFGEPRQGSAVCVIGKSAYIFTGTIGLSDYVTDVLKFTPSASVPWTYLDPLVDLAGRKYDNDYGMIPRSYATAFVVGSDADRSARIYLVSGSRGSLLTDCWEFNPYEDLGYWEEVTSLPVSATRQGGVAFTLNGTGYITVGGSSMEGAGVRQTTYLFEPGFDDDDQDDNWIVPRN